MGKKIDKFLLLMWKNWILQIRHPIQTIFEILVPAFFCAILVVIRSLVTVHPKPEVQFEEYRPYFPHSLRFGSTIAYSPNVTDIMSIMTGVEDTLAVSKLTFTPMPNSQKLNSFINTGDRRIGVVFDDALISQDLPKKVEFSLRFPAELPMNQFGDDNWKTNQLYPLLQLGGARDSESTRTAFPDYYGEGFLTLQQTVSEEIIRHFCKTENPADCTIPEIKMRRFPYPEYTSDPLLSVLQQMIGMIMVLAFVYTSISIIKIITAEKEKQLKESMKIMGLPIWLHWTAWFIKSVTFMLISIIIMIALFKIEFWYADGVQAILPKCDIFVLFLFFLLYACSIITLSFAISVFFTRANLASGIGGVVFFFFYVPYTLLQNKYHTLSLGTKLLASLTSNSAMGYGFQLLCMFESTEEGLQWHNLWKTATPGDNLVMGHILLMLLADTVIYMLIALYVEAIFPGSYGVPKKWHFIFTWVLPKKAAIGDFNEELNQDPTCFEREPTKKKAGIKISHLRKVYSNVKVAVRDLSLNMYEDQITVLLGHNGAGKTTTMSMLTGMFPPTSGTAVINDHDIESDIDSVRSSLGLCPQHNVLFDELTVAEHIYFFSRLKGMPRKEIKPEIDNYVKILQFEDKKDNKAATLSGGMKRKLSVAVAFCGNSKVVMLDEPTAGMDPAARRALWELVVSQKKGRTIMLTTHFMDEADLLGDRIAIMADGTLQCCGSSFFLKKRYGTGYHLIIDKNPGCDVERLTGIMSSHIPEVKVHSNIGSELSYLLNEKDSQHFQAMLKDVETSSEELGIRSYGISLTTLEDVFMKVGADKSHEEINDVKELSDNQSNNSDVNELSENSDNQSNASDTKVVIIGDYLLTGGQLIMNQIKAMFMKRALTTLRQWPLLLVQFLIPVFLLIVAIFAARTVDSQDLPKRIITINSYDKPVTTLALKEPNEYYEASKAWLKQSKNKVLDIESNDMSTTIMNITKLDPSALRMHYIIGSTFSKDKIVGWYNNEPYHSPPLALNFILNSVLKKTLGQEYEISVSNHPASFTFKSKFRKLQQGNNMGFQIAVNIGFCMAFISAFYILFYIKERITKAKHLQLVSGVNIIIFWLISLIWDWMTYVVTIILLLLTLICFQEDGFKSPSDIAHMVVIFAYFGFALFPVIYLASFIFSSPASGFIRVVLVGVILGNFAFMVVEILSIGALNLTSTANTLDWIFLIVPHYSLSTGIRNINKEYERYTNCKIAVDFLCDVSGIPEDMSWSRVCLEESMCCDKTENYYEWEGDGILRNIVLAVAVGIVATIFLFMVEYKIFATIIYKLQRVKPNKDPSNEEDDDVKAENEKIRNMSEEEIKQQTLVVRNITKYYKNFLAVDGICLGVNNNECFGLLGVNGAGKTTTFKMITGDTHISYGEVYVKGLDLKTQNMEVNKLIGYCPQFDALLDELTARETIELFALLRGYTKYHCKTIAIKLAQDFSFYQHIDKKVNELSGGNKRKLSTAVALVGDPPILYLDEPTTGMDPAAKRFLWNALCKVRDSGKCLILTSHSMEECEALCTRLAIMVNGKFKCLGSTQHLKNKFSQGYTLIVKLSKAEGGTGRKSSTNVNVITYIRNAFPSAVIRETHQELITFYIPNTAYPWSEMFGVMEQAKVDLSIEDYSLGQSSLEQVFLMFTNFQDGE